MVKRQTMLTIDIDIVEKAKAARLNMSQISEQALRTALNVAAGDVGSIDMQLEIERSKKAEAKIRLWSNIKNEADSKLKMIQDVQQQEKEKELERKREAALSQKKCIECGAVHDKGYKWHVFEAGGVCQQCFFTSDRIKIDRWSAKSNNPKREAKS